VLANWITISRFPLLLINVLLLYRGSASMRMAGVALLFIGLMLDTVDGMVARKTGQTSLFGSVLDIAADRLGLIPLVIPLIVIARTTLTDAFRSIGVGQGTAPLAQHRTPLGRFLVGSTFMRVGYSIAKTTTFCGLALAQALSGFPSRTHLVPPALAALQIVAWAAVTFCLLRGLPVIMHAVRRYFGVERPAGQARLVTAPASGDRPPGSHR
jgi:phosphatidylglycerophosphate synthase